MSNILDINTIRKNYPITRHDIYLNHAATAPISQSAIDRIQNLASQMQRPLGEHFYAWLGILEDTRRHVAELINAHPTEIAFCQNTSTGLSLIADAISFQPGDRVLVPRNEFPSNIYIWQNLREKGVIFEFFEVEAGVPVVETLSKINFDAVRLISISAVSYLTGRHYELKAIADFCRQRNILICYDAIQALGVVPFDVKEIQPDFIASGAQKWLLGSIGVGFIYARKELLEKLTVPLVGWTSVKYPEDFSLKELDFAADMTRFEPGLPDILTISALNESLCDLAALGWDNVFEKIKQNTTYLTQALSSQGIETFAARDKSAGIVAFNLPKHLNLNALLEVLAKRKIHITQRENYIRVSPHFYNTQEELDVFLEVLKIKSQHAMPETKPIQSENTERSILITGATGILGKMFANKLAAISNVITLVGKDEVKLTKLKQELNNSHKASIETFCVDFNNAEHYNLFLQKLTQSNKKYDALINCAGIAEADEFKTLSVEKFTDMLQINCVSAFQLMQLFVNQLKTANALGILNIVSPTGRCGWPLLSGYAASQAALWSLTEVMARELSQSDTLTITTYVAPPMHSRMQKRLGREALRYLKLSGNFPYKHAVDVANEAWEMFTKKKTLYVNSFNRRSLWLNAFLPSVISKRIKKIWKANK